jgi:hypothetical protein
MFVASRVDSRECNSSRERFASSSNRTYELMDVLTSKLKEYIKLDTVNDDYDDDDAAAVATAASDDDDDDNDDDNNNDDDGDDDYDDDVNDDDDDVNDYNALPLE